MTWLDNPGAVGAGSNPAANNHFKDAMKKIYISGPMTGYPENNFPAFHAHAALLREQGHEVVNPAEINVGLVEPAHGTPEWQAFYQACLRADIRALCDCDAISLLPGWENSNGAHLELHIAHRLGLEVLISGVSVDSSSYRT